MLNCAILIGYSVNCVTGNVLTAAERSKQMGKVKANAFLGMKCFANIEILEDHMVAKHVNATKESLSDFIRRAISETMERDKVSKIFDSK